MAFGVIAKAGTKFGHCVEDCAHIDCKEQRERVKSVCRFCNEEISYERKFQIEENGNFVHFDCALKNLEGNK